MLSPGSAMLLSVFCLLLVLGAAKLGRWLARPKPELPKRKWYFSMKRGLHDSISHAGWCNDQTACEEVEGPY